jgi:hypothetical protein
LFAVFGRREAAGAFLFLDFWSCQRERAATQYVPLHCTVAPGSLPSADEELEFPSDVA